MKNKTLIQQILIVALVLFVVLQFFQIDKTNPPIEGKQDFLQVTNPPTEVATILKVACYDCHANTTAYPWYTNIQPVAWWIKGHIDNGRKHLNFSEWTTYTAKKQAHKIEECIEIVAEKEMPMLSYMVAHQDAWLNDEQRQLLVNWFKTLE